MGLCYDGQSSNKVEPSSVIVMLLSVYTHLTKLSTSDSDPHSEVICTGMDN